MGVRSNMAEWWNGELAGSRATYMRHVGLPSGGLQVPNLLALPAEAYEYPKAYALVPTIRFAVDLIQNTIASLPLKFYQTMPGGEPTEVERTPTLVSLGRTQPRNIADLWATANDEDTGYDLMEQIGGSLLISGNAYLFKDYSVGAGPASAFWMLDPMRVIPVTDQSTRRIAYYRVRVGYTDQVVLPEQIVAFRMFNPEMQLEGLSPLSALQLDYETQRDARRFQREFYRKGGMVAGHYSTEQPLTPDEVDRLKRELKDRVQGPRNAWDMVVLPRKLKYERAGLTMSEMQFVETNSLTTADILRVFKIPPVMAGIKERGGLSDAGASTDALLFWENAIQPLSKRIETTINERLLASGEFGLGLTCRFDTTGVLAYQEVFLNQAKAYAVITGGPVMTREEARERLDLIDLNDATLGELLIPSTMDTASGKQASADAAALAAAKPAPAIVPPDPQAMSRATRNARDEKRARHALVVSQYEDRFTSLWRKLMREQQHALVARLGAGLGRSNGKGSRVLDVNDLMQAIIDDPDSARVRDLLEAIVGDVGDETLNELGVDLAWDLSAPDMRAYIHDRAGRQVRMINDTTRARLVEALDEGITAGEGLSELIGRIDLVFAGRTAADILRIARTETTSIFNYAKEEAYKRSGVVEGKEWLTAHDELVRATHTEAEAQGALPLNAPFTVGASLMMFPGDPNGDAGEVINCRCTITPTIAPLGGRAIKNRLSEMFK